MGTIIGVKEEKVRGSGMMNSWLHVSKMRTIPIGASMVVLAFMLN
jgi:hypothetical protein